MRAITGICVMLATCVISTSAYAAKTYKGYKIEFKPQPSKGMLHVDTDGQGCQKGPGNQQKKKGCIRFEEDDFGLITFQLGSQPNVKSCGVPGTKWVISKIELTAKGYQLNTGSISNKGIFEDHLPLPDWMKYAFPQVDQDTGVWYEASPGNTGPTQVQLLNLNNNDPGDGTKDIWYRVTVASCEDGSDAVLVTDPRFENDGGSN